MQYPDVIRVYDRRTNHMQSISGKREHMRYSQERQLWILTAGNELWEISDRGDVRLLERVGDTITSAYAIPNTTYIAYSTPKSVVLLDTFFGLRYILIKEGISPIVHGASNNPKRILYEQENMYFTIAIE